MINQVPSKNLQRPPEALSVEGKPNAIKIVFFGTSEFAVPALKSLVNFGYKVEAVVTQPEKPVGRARVIMPSPVKKAAFESRIQVFEPHNLRKDEEFFEKFKNLNPDLCVVAAYGKIIPSQYLEIPKYGFLNIHPSLLPKYRGPSPVQTAIMDGCNETGVTIMKMDEGVDHGGIVSSIKYLVSSIKEYKDIEQETAKLGTELLIDILPKYISGKIKPKEQDHSQATFTKLLTREDGRIDWNKTAEEIYNQIRALNPEPGTWTLLRLKSFGGRSKVLNIPEANYLEVELPSSSEAQLPGMVLKLNYDIVVAAKKCYLILKQIQLEGGKEMDAKSFLNGHPDFLGSRLE